MVAVKARTNRQSAQTPHQRAISSKAQKSPANRVDQVRKREQVSNFMNARHELPRLLTSNEVADALNVHPRTLMRLAQDVHSKFPKPVLLGRAVRWRADHIQAWMGDQS